MSLVARIPRLMLIAGVLFMSIVSASAQAAQPGQSLPTAPDAGPKVTVLENGLTVLCQEDHRFPLASVRLYVRTGSAYETPRQAGISHLLEHMVFKGTAKRAPGQAAADVEGVGGALNAATSFDYTVYYVDMPKTQWTVGLDVIGDMIFGARIDPDELAQEKNVVLSELARGDDTPGQRLFKTLQQQMFSGTSYGWPIIGFKETVSAVSRDDMLGYIREHYQPQSMVLVVVGDVDPAQVLAAAQAQFGGLRNDRLLTPATALPDPALATGKPLDGPRVDVIPGEWNKVYLAAAFPIPGLRSDAAAGLDVLAHILGGDRSSRWYNRFKYDKRLVDDISVSAMTMERAGVLYVSATMDAAKVHEFWKEFTAELSALTHGKTPPFSPEELGRAKLNLEDDLYQTKETLSGLASKIGYFQTFSQGPGGGQQAEGNYLYQVRNVDPRQLQDLVASYLRPERLNVAVLTPKGTSLTSQDMLTTAVASWPSGAPGAVAATAVSGSGKAGQVEVIDVGRGRVVLLPDPTLPYTALSISWPGGDGLTPVSEDGLPELAARVLTKGAGSKNAQEIQNFLSDHAAALSVSAGRDSFSLVAKYPQRFESELLGLVQDVALHPSWRSDEIARGIEEQRAAIKSREDQPLGLAFRRIFPFLFDASAYGRTHLGQPEALGGFDAAHLRSFWQQQAGQPFVLSACGVFDKANILALAKALDHQVPVNGKVYVFEYPTFRADKTLDIKLPGRNQLHLMRIFPVVGQENPDSAGLELLRAALAGQSGILFRDMRDKQGLGYSVTAFLWQAPRSGFMSFYIGTEPDKRAQALAGFETAIRNLREQPLPEAELQRAVNLLEGDYYRDNQSLMARAGEASSAMAHGLDRDYTRKLIDKAKTLTPADLQALAQKYLLDDKAYTVTVEP